MVFQPRTNEVSTQMVILRMTEKEKSQLRELAEQCQLSMSEFIRRKSLGKPVIADSHSVIVNELRRIGTILTNIHKNSNDHVSDESFNVLQKVRYTMDSLFSERI